MIKLFCRFELNFISRVKRTLLGLAIDPLWRISLFVDMYLLILYWEMCNIALLNIPNISLYLKRFFNQNLTKLRTYLQRNSVYILI